MSNKTGITPRERLEAALLHKESDRIPFDLASTRMTGISMTAYRNLLDYKGWNALDPQPEIGDTMQQLALVKEPVLQKLGVDVRGLIPSAPSNWQLNFVERGEYTEYIDEWGVLWRKPRKSGYYFDMTSHPLAGISDLSGLDSFAWPNAADKSRTEGYEKHLDFIAAQGDYGFTLHGVSAGVMEMSLRLRGFEQFFMDLALEPDLACSIFDRIVDIKIAYWDAALEKVGNKVLVAIESDDLGTQDSLLISPGMYREYLKPRHQRLFSFIKKKAPHIKVFLHCCGSIMPLIPDLIEAGVDILNPVQVSARNMDTKTLKKEFGKDLVFWGGGIDTQGILPHGSVKEIKDEVRRRIDDLAPGGGFIFNTVHNIQADVPPQNIEAMLETLQEYGIYR